MRRFDPTRSLLAGMDTTVLQARLTAMQLDYLDLSSGRKPMSASYAQGDGSKSVSYTMATIGQMVMAIRQLQAQLGIIERPRGAIGIRF